MPKRKVVQTVIIFRDGARLRPTIGEVFDFTAEELASITALNPHALDRPVISVDLENVDAQKKAEADAQAEAEAAAKAEAEAKKAADGKGKGKTSTAKTEQDEEV